MFKLNGEVLVMFFLVLDVVDLFNGEFDDDGGSMRNKSMLWVIRLYLYELNMLVEDYY